MTALTTLGVTLLLAALSWRYIEAPCIRYVRRH
jgi:peptidoglycan/LPS O-acetylase OafA/YrhL